MFGARLERCVVRGNRITSFAYGAGVFAGFGSAIADCLIEDNHVRLDGNGGGVALFGGSSITRSVVRRNVVPGDPGGSGGGITCADATIEDCRIEENIASGAFGGIGGGTYCQGDASIRRCLFVANRALSLIQGTGWGGAIASGGDAAVQIEDCVFVGNRVEPELPGNDGGAIGASFESVVVNRCTFLQNSSGMDNGTVMNSIFVGCTTGPACSGNITIRCCDFWGNAYGDGFCGNESVGNFAADPQFCAVDPATSLNVGLQSDSPCGPNSPCGRIGAADVLCGPVAVLPISWGGVKQLYRR
jgi:hypothetical protein